MTPALKLGNQEIGDIGESFEPHREGEIEAVDVVNGHLNRAIDYLLPWAYVASQPLKAVA